MTSTIHTRSTRRKILAVSIALIALSGCKGMAAGAPGRIAFQRQLSGQIYAIELSRDFTVPVTAADAAFFKQIAPLEWDRVRDQAVIDRVVTDFNANRAQWQELPPYKRDLLWHSPPEPPL